MLQTIRETLTGWVAIFILGALALSLVVTFGDIDTGFSGNTVAATVNGDDISMQEFRRLYDQQRQQWEANFREQLPDNIAQTMADSVIQSLINNRLMMSYVRDQGYRVNNAEVIQAIQNIEAFQVGGEFSRLTYEDQLRASGYSSQLFEFEQRQNMEAQQFSEGLQSSAFYTPNQFRRYIELDGESRAVKYLLLGADDWMAKVKIEPAAVEEYYAENGSSFLTDETVDLEYVEVDYNQILADVEIDEAEAQAYFDANSYEFTGPDDRLISHILIPTGDDETAALVKALSLLDRINEGEDFAALARDNSADTFTAARGGDLGWLGSGEMPAAEFETALAAMQPGDVSEPVRTEYGYHLIKFVDSRASDGVEFADVRDELVARLRDDQAAALYGERLDELDDLALESLDGLASVATAMGLELKTIKGFSQNGAAPLGNSRSLIDTVFSLEVLEDGENSQIIELDDGRAVVLRVVQHYLPEQKPLQDVREEIVARLRGTEAMLLAASAGNEIVTRLAEGADEEALAAEYSAEWQTRPEVRRGGSDLPPDLVAAVFKASRAAADSDYAGTLLASGDYAIFKVTAIKPGRPELFEPEVRDQRKQQLASQQGMGELNALLTDLTNAADTKVTPNLVNNDSDLL